MKHLFTLFALVSLLFPARLFSQTVTWSSDLAAIFYGNCTKCHNTGGLAPFPIETYNDALTWSGTISSYVSARKMPPWPPDPNYCHYSNERALRQG